MNPGKTSHPLLARTQSLTLAFVMTVGTAALPVSFAHAQDAGAAQTTPVAAPSSFNLTTATNDGVREGTRVARSVLAVEGVIQNIRYSIAQGFAQHLNSFLNVDPTDINYKKGYAQGAADGSTQGTLDGRAMAANMAKESAGNQLSAQASASAHQGVPFSPGAGNPSFTLPDFSNSSSAPAAPNWKSLMASTSSALRNVNTDPSTPSYLQPQGYETMPAMDFSMLTTNFVTGMSNIATAIIAKNQNTMLTAYLNNLNVNDYMAPEKIIAIVVNDPSLRSMFLNGDPGLDAATVWKNYSSSVLKNGADGPGRISTAAKKDFAKMASTFADQNNDGQPTYVYSDATDAMTAFGNGFQQGYQQIINREWNADVTRPITLPGNFFPQQAQYDSAFNSYSYYQTSAQDSIIPEANKFMVEMGIEILIRKGIHAGYVNAYQAAASAAFNRTYTAAFNQEYSRLAKVIATTANLGDVAYSDTSVNPNHTLGDQIVIGVKAANYGGVDGSFTTAVTNDQMYSINGSAQQKITIGRFSSLATPRALIDMPITITQLPGRPDDTISIHLQLDGQAQIISVPVNITFEALVNKLATTQDTNLQARLAQTLGVFLKAEWDSNGSDIAEQLKRTDRASSVLEHRMVTAVSVLPQAAKLQFARLAQAAVTQAYPTSQPKKGWLGTFSGKFNSWAAISAELRSIGLSI